MGFVCGENLGERLNKMGNVRLENCLRRYPALEICSVAVDAAFHEMRIAFEGGGKLLICGNGGSAADSDHIAGELLKGFDSRRRLGAEWEAKLGPVLAGKLQGALPVIPLTGFPAISTAWANDCDGDYIFAQLAFALGRAGDVLLCISTSGNSKNVLHAAKVARAKGLRIIALTGESGGQLASEADVCVRVPANIVWEIQEYHLPVYHTLCLMLEDHFFHGEEEEKDELAD
jgi:D-sedoheptulose 7-phosphate isomerase